MHYLDNQYWFEFEQLHAIGISRHQLRIREAARFRPHPADARRLLSCYDELSGLAQARIRHFLLTGLNPEQFAAA